MGFGMKACTGMTCWIGGIGTLIMMIGFGFSVVNFSTGALFVATSLVSLGSQKKDNSDSGFRCRDADEVETFDGEAFSFESSASGFQKKESSEMGFVRGVTGEETTFLGGAIQSFTTCCTEVSWEGTVMVVILLVGNAFSKTTSWTGGDGILISVTLYGLWALRGTTFCLGGDAIVVWSIGKEG